MSAPEDDRGDKAYYVTTPIYYVNDAPHIGHAYTTVAGDVLTRWHRQRGERVWFLTGTDEHGQKVLRSAEANGAAAAAVGRPPGLARRGCRCSTCSRSPTTTSSAPPRSVTHAVCRRSCSTCTTRARSTRAPTPGPTAWAARSSSCRATSWRVTTASSCVRSTRARWRRSRRPTGSSGSRRTPSRCSTTTASTLRRSSRPRPATRCSASSSPGLTDLSISRSSFAWGIPIPWDTSQVTYVWFDALLNYATAVGYGEDDPALSRQFDSTWPADVHLVGKDILRFHAVIWPAMLMAAGLPLPGKVFAHGWLLVGGEKMSKSKLTGIAPSQITDHFGADAFRYYFLSAIPFGHDGSFSWEHMSAVYTSELANGLGNLASRVAAMVGKYFDGTLPAASADRQRPSALWRRRSPPR